MSLLKQSDTTTFSLKFNFQVIGPVSIYKGQGLFVHTTDSDFVDTFFDWLDGRKYYPEASIEFSDNNENTSDLYIIRKQIITVRFRLSDNENVYFYYQQRYHATENDNVATLKDFLGEICDPYFDNLLLKLGLDKLLREKINMLSSGEFRKAFFIKASMTKPCAMFIEEPYTGIDTKSIELLNELFAYLLQNGMSVIIFASTGSRPDFIKNSLSIGGTENSGHFYNVKYIKVPDPYGNTNFINAFELKNVSANYDGRDVLHNINWTVSRNQKWSLTGHNGAGKSTLLSFVNADNPQVYCNNVHLFDRKRGSGETIWEIKDRIGFYSPEFHRYFNKLMTVEDAINSIVFQNPYEKRVLSCPEENFKLQLLNYFELVDSDQKMLCDLSVINQKLILLSAVMIKNAPLLILDEPFQGFSDQLIKKSVALINKYVEKRTFIMVSHNHSDFPVCINKHFYLKNGIGKELDELIDIENY
jgi:molybdate transport system ATP-binding protein